MVRSDRHRALWALLLLIPAPTVGVLFWMWISPGDYTMWVVSKLWLFGLPAAWWLWIDRGKPTWSPMRQGGVLPGVVTGIAIMLIIAGSYVLIGQRWIDVAATRQGLIDKKLGSLPLYLGLCAYWIFINSVLEEYVWRWFVYRKCEIVLTSRAAAVVASALLFTLHHTLALGFNFAWEWRIVLLGSLGVFIGGSLWSWLYARYRSIWPGWISHAFADVGVFVVGYLILFT